MFRLHSSHPLLYSHITMDKWTRPIGDQSTSKSCREMFQATISTNRLCLQNRTLSPPVDIWSTLTSAVHYCIDKDLWDRLDVQILENSGDFKFVVLPGQKGTKCTEVTLGVGGDIDAEITLKKLLPRCKFYGADPILKSGKIFSKIGTYFHIAVSSESGIMRASVYENGQYINKDVETVNFTSFITKMAKIDSIDHLWMDVEGAEYKITPKYLIKPEIAICQWTVEMHARWDNTTPLKRNSMQ